MSILSVTVAGAAALGAALVGGIFFAFSSFIMKALGRRPAAEGIAAMQSINVVVLNSSFLGTFFGTGVAAVAAAVLASIGDGSPSATWYIAGAVCYCVGTLLVTIAGNVPLNNRLAAMSPTDPAAGPVWQHYLKRWTLLNTIRTVAAALAAVLIVAGLVSGAAR